MSWTGDTLRGDKEDNYSMRQKPYFEVESDGEIPPGRVRGLDGSISTVVPRTDSEGQVPPPVPPKDTDLENQKYGRDMVDL